MHWLWQQIDLIFTKILVIQEYFLFAYHKVSEQQAEIISALLLLFCFSFIFYQYVYKMDRVNSNGYTNIRPTHWYYFSANSQLKKRDRQLLLGTILSVVIVLMSLLIRQSYFAPQWQIIMQDIGQGLSVIIRKGNHAVIYDTGTAWPNGSMAELETIPYLSWQGMKVDTLIISHDDKDHAGGVRALLNAFPHSQFITSSDGYYQYPSQHCIAGQNWNWRGLKFEVYWPSKTVARAKNADSCVIRVSSEKFSFLLTGDIGIDEEKELKKENLKSDIIQIAHHGSKYSSSKVWLEQLSPNIALISAGRWNPWHHPANETIKRLKSENIDNYTTSYHGQITLSINGRYYNIQNARGTWQPWYRIYIGEK